LDHGSICIASRFIRQIDPANLDTEVVLSRSTSAKLRGLLPHSEWPSQPE